MQIATGEYGESIMSTKNVTSMDKIQQPIIKDNSKTIAQTIEESGLNSLEENATSDNLYLAIQRFVELSSGRDEAWRKIALSEVTKVLKKKEDYTGIHIEVEGNKKSLEKITQIIEN